MLRVEESGKGRDKKGDRTERVKRGKERKQKLQHWVTLSTLVHVEYNTNKVS